MLSSLVCEGADRTGGVIWIHPDVIAEVSYSELMQGRLRDPMVHDVRPLKPRYRAIRRATTIDAFRPFRLMLCRTLIVPTAKDSCALDRLTR